MHMLSRIPYFLLILVCAVAVAGTLATGDSKLKSTSVVKDLLAYIQRGDVNAARQLFGDNTCSCPPRGGWISLLRYESGHEPNLAFLLRQRFVTSDMENQAVPSAHHYVFPWDKPEDRKVDLNIRFGENLPYFLPLPLAFGIPMQATEFKQWRNTFASEINQRAFTLRLRNSLKSGTIAQVQPDKHESLLPASVRKYIHPRDCAKVLDASGMPLPLESLASLLPRLQSVHVCFLVVKRGVLSPWTIKSPKFTEPVWLLQ
jgi:hypothetical protein